MTQQLLANGAEPDCIDPTECTPLMIAAQNGCISIFNELLSSGASILARDRSQLNALGHAIVGTQPEIVRELLKRGMMAPGNSSQAEYALGLAEATARKKRDVASNDLLMFLANRAAAATIGDLSTAAGQVHEPSPTSSQNSQHMADEAAWASGGDSISNKSDATPAASPVASSLASPASHK